MFCRVDIILSENNLWMFTNGYAYNTTDNNLRLIVYSELACIVRWTVEGAIVCMTQHFDQVLQLTRVSVQTWLISRRRRRRCSSQAAQRCIPV